MNKLVSNVTRTTTRSSLRHSFTQPTTKFNQIQITAQVKMNRLIKEKIVIVGTVFSNRRFKYTQRLEEIYQAPEVIDLTESEDEEVAQFSDDNISNYPPRTPPAPRFSSPVQSGNVTPFLASNGKNGAPFDPYLSRIVTPDFEKDVYDREFFGDKINKVISETTSESSSESDDNDAFCAPREDVRN